MDRSNQVYPERKQRVSRKPWGAIFAFIGPALVYFGIFVLYPVADTVYNSFHRIAPISGQLVTTFVGFGNFIQLFGDHIFAMAVNHTLIWATVGPAIEMVTATLLAVVVYFKVPLSRFYRVMWFSPLLVQGVIVGLVFRWIFNNDWGLLNGFLRMVGLGSLATNWLGEPGFSLAAVILTHYWATFGFSFVLMLTGLSTVDKEVIESALIDGANRFQISLKLLFPLTIPTFFAAVMLSFLGKMQAFNVVWILTQGGPMHMTETVATYVQKRAFDWNTFDLGYPSAISVIWFGLVVVLVSMFNRWTSRRLARDF